MANPVARCNQSGRIPRAALTHLFRNGFTGDHARGFNHLPHAEALPISQVVNAIALLKRLQREHVCFGQIQHMNIVTNAGAIGCVVVVAEDRNVIPLPSRDLQNQGYEMGFGRVMLSSHLTGARSVEITEAREAQALGL